MDVDENVFSRGNLAHIRSLRPKFNVKHQVINGNDGQELTIKKYRIKGQNLKNSFAGIQSDSKFKNLFKR